MHLGLRGSCRSRVGDLFSLSPCAFDAFDSENRLLSLVEEPWPGGVALSGEEPAHVLKEKGSMATVIDSFARSVTEQAVRISRNVAVSQS